MNIKGGITYIDFKGVNILNPSITVRGLTKETRNAYKFKKLVVAHMVKVGDELLNDIPIHSIRQRTGGFYTFVIPYPNSSDAKLTLRYVVVGTNDTATTYVGSVG